MQSFITVSVKEIESIYNRAHDAELVGKKYLIRFLEKIVAQAKAAKSLGSLHVNLDSNTAVSLSQIKELVGKSEEKTSDLKAKKQENSEELAKAFEEALKEAMARHRPASQLRPIRRYIEPTFPEYFGKSEFL